MRIKVHTVDSQPSLMKVLHDKAVHDINQGFDCVATADDKMAQLGFVEGMVALARNIGLISYAEDLEFTYRRHHMQEEVEE